MQKPYRHIGPIKNHLAGVLLVAAFLQVITQPGLANPPGLSNNWYAVNALSDEFNGERLDATKWRDLNPTWLGRPPVLFDPACVAVTKGELCLTAPKSDGRTLPKGFTHRCGYIMARSLVRYGYFEIRAKLMDSTLVSCFWLYENTPAEWTEIDIFEAPAGVPEYRRKLSSNAHVFHSPTYKGDMENHLQHPLLWDAPYDVSADYHVYGLEWDEKVIRWYVDGALIREQKNTGWHQPLYLCINIEANESLKALPDDRRLPGVYRIDYVRTWERRINK